MAHSLRGRAAIAGIGTAGTGEAPGRSSIELLGEAAIAAIADAGLKLSDVDGIFAATGVHGLPALSAAEYLALSRVSSRGRMWVARPSRSICSRPRWRWRPGSATSR
jgi:hypothetical protein